MTATETTADAPAAPKPRTPLDERDQLVAERVQARKMADEARVWGIAARVDLANAEQARDELYASAARGHDEGANLKAANGAVAAAKEQVELAARALEGAAVAQDACLQELQRLYLREVDAFAAEAQLATDAATAALEALRAPYAEAQKRWAAAQSAWGPVGPALLAQNARREDDEGFWRDRQAVSDDSKVPPCPLEPFPMGQTARPALVRFETTTEEEPPEPDPVPVWTVEDVRQPVGENETAEETRLRLKAAGG